MAFGDITFDEFGVPHIAGMAPVRTPRAAAPTLSEQEEESLWSQMGSGMWSGIGAVGAGMDVPRSIVNNLLTGKDPTQPLRQPLSGVGRASGRDVLVGLGAAPKNVEGMWWESSEALADAPWDIAGVATEIATDPLTYLTLGLSAVGKVGKALKAAGAMDDVAKQAAKRLAKSLGRTPGRRESLAGAVLQDVFDSPRLAARYGDRISDYARAAGTTVDDLMKEPVYHQAGFKFPFVDRVVPIATKEGTRRLARGLDVAGAAAMKVPFVEPATRRLTAMFDHAVKNTVTAKGQEAARRLTKEEAHDVAETRGLLLPYVRSLHEGGWFDPREVQKRAAADGVELTNEQAQQQAIDLGMQLKRYAETKQKVGSFSHMSPEDTQKAMEAMDGLTAHLDAELSRTKGYGVKVDKLNDIMDGILKGYLPRQPTVMPGQKIGAAGSRTFKVNQPFMNERDLHGFPGGVYALDRISLDPEISGLRHRTTTLDRGTRKKARSYLKKKYGREIWGDHRPVYEDGKVKGYQLLDVLDEEGAPKVISKKDYEEANSKIVNWAVELDKRHADKGVPAYNWDPVESALRYAEQSAQARQAAQGTYEFLSQNAGTLEDMQVSGVSGSRTAYEVLSKNKALDTDKAVERFLETLQEESPDVYNGAVREATENLKKGQELTDKRIAREVFVAPEIVEDANRFMSTFTETEAVGQILQAWDKFTRMWKGSVTVPWPGFHSRNGISGLVRNWVAGVWDWDSYLDSMAVLDKRRAKIRGAASKYKVLGARTDEEATERIYEELFKHQVLTHHSGVAGEISYSTGLSEEVPGLTKIVPPRPPGTTRAQNLNPFADASAVQRYGSAASYLTEGMNRIPPFLNLLKKGYSPEEAAEMVRLLQVDYSRASDFVRKRVTRVFPFAKFTLGVIPWTVKSLIERPGGRLAQIAKGTSRLRADEPVMPEYVHESAAMSLPRSKEGNLRFLTTLGLMEEPFYAMAAPLAKLPVAPMEAIGDTGREILAQSHPVLRMIPELAFRKSSFYGGGEPGGRDIRTLTPPVGQVLENVAEGGLGKHAAGLMKRVIGEPTEGRPSPMGVRGGEGSPLLRAAEYGLMSSPLARVVSSARTITDPRKGAMERLSNFAFAIKTIDVSKGQENALKKEMLDEAMINLGGTRFTATSVPEHLMNKLTPEKRQEAERLKLLRSSLNRSMRGL